MVGLSGGRVGYLPLASKPQGGVEMSNWFYIAGSLCFLIGTILNMLGIK